jgi:succinate dehydrogenase/fumarate reductase flavoprotein subunit
MGGAVPLSGPLPGARLEDRRRGEGQYRSQRCRRAGPVHAINCYKGMQWDENQPEDPVRYARNDLMGMVHEDLACDMARHADSEVHKTEDWCLPLMRDPKTGQTSAKANGRS